MLDDSTFPEPRVQFLEEAPHRGLHKFGGPILGVPRIRIFGCGIYGNTWKDSHRNTILGLLGHELVS